MDVPGRVRTPDQGKRATADRFGRPKTASAGLLILWCGVRGPGGAPLGTRLVARRSGRSNPFSEILQDFSDFFLFSEGFALRAWKRAAVSSRLGTKRKGGW